MSLDIKWEGLEELITTISNAHPKAVEQAINVTKNNTEAMKAKAVLKAPRDTGFLKGSINTSYSGMQGEARASAGYSGFQEYGTRFMSAQPFMRPALDEQRPIYEKDMTDVMKGAFK